MLLEERLISKGVNVTAARIMIYRKMAELGYPVSLSDLERELDTVDKSTIFRSLSVLLEHHAIHSFEDGSGSTKYEVCHRCEEECHIEDRHIHFYCECCKRTTCLYDIKVPTVSLPEGYCATSINYTIKGICANCRK